MVCCCGRGMAEVFGAFVMDCEVFEVMEPWTQHCPDVLTSLVRFLSEKGVGSFDLITHDVADGSSERQRQCLAHLGAGLGVSPRIFHIQGLRDRTAHFIGLSGVCVVRLAEEAWTYVSQLEIHRSLLHSSAPRVGLLATKSPCCGYIFSTQWAEAGRQRRRRCHRRMAAYMCFPRAFRRRLRHFRWVEQVETEGRKLSARVRCSGEGLRPLRLIPELVGPPPVCLWNVRQVLRSIGSVLRFFLPSSSASWAVCWIFTHVVQMNLCWRGGSAASGSILWRQSGHRRADKVLEEKLPPALRKWSRTFRALVARTANW